MRRLKKTAKDTATIEKAIKLMNNALQKDATTVEEAEDIMSDIELLALEIRAAAKHSAKILENTKKDVSKYLKENVE